VDKKVKCPGCGVIFTASPEPEAGPEAPIVLQEESPTEPAEPQPIRPARPEERFEERARQGYGDEFGYAERRQFRQESLSRIKAPAICLLITGVLGLMCNCVSTVHLLATDPQAMKQQIANLQLPPEWQKFAEQAAESSRSPITIAMRFGFLAVNVILIASAIAMMMGRMYWLAMVGSIMALINIGDCCCLLSLPFGIWSLVVLNNPEVKSAFE
jgi:hypothetical protein